MYKLQITYTDILGFYSEKGSTSDYTTDYIRLDKMTIDMFILAVQTGTGWVVKWLECMFRSREVTGSSTGRTKPKALMLVFSLDTEY